MARSYYNSPIARFRSDETSFILGELVKHHEFNLEEHQRNAWYAQIQMLKSMLEGIDGYIIFEYTIPRMGRRIDCVLLVAGIVFAVEFKVGAATYDSAAIDQVMDYALDLKNFHEESHQRTIVPILICTRATTHRIRTDLFEDQVASPALTNGSHLAYVLHSFENTYPRQHIDPTTWIDAAYKPTPTIIEAAQALYRGHTVHEISRSDSGAINLSRTASAISAIIERSKKDNLKSICFLTGVPGAGKTLAGLNLANSWHNVDASEHAVFLSGNGPLVEVLTEALANNEVASTKGAGRNVKKSTAISKAKAFIQNIHHFRDDALNTTKPPIEKVVVFDEAQRAWTLKKTADFMRMKKGYPDFRQSEPEFLISAMDRHHDWATIICLIGGGQEINTGEAGLTEWFDALKRSFPHWQVYVSSKLTDSEYTQGRPLYKTTDSLRVVTNDDLHLAVSIRSFRSEKVAALIKALLDTQLDTARSLCSDVCVTYPIVITRDLLQAKQWLRRKARGSERFGLIASSGALRLRPVGIHVRAEVDPTHWFLSPKDDVRSSFYLEDVATEFSVQGLELDWTCVAWDADLRFVNGQWHFKAFRGTVWQEVNDAYARLYLKNAYRVLLTRARQGMIIFIPKGRKTDPTRLPEFYDGTYEYLRSLGLPVLEISDGD